MSVVSLRSLVLDYGVAHGLGLRGASLRIPFIEKDILHRVGERTGKKLRVGNDAEREGWLGRDIPGDCEMLDRKGGPFSCNGYHVAQHGSS